MKKIDTYINKDFFQKGLSETRNRPVVFLVLSSLLIVVCWAYIPGTRLFFRNDDWELMGLLEPLINRDANYLRNLWEFLQGKQIGTIKHFHPVSLFISMLKYSILGNNFAFHFVLSLSFHLVNIILVYFLGLRLSSQQNAALMGAILFGSSALISDTLLWAGQFAFILVTTLTLMSLCLHPTHARNRFNSLASICFYLVTAIAPLVFELGMVTVLIGISLFLVKRPLKVLPIILLILFLILPMFARMKLIGSVTTGVYFVGLSHLFYNIFASSAKILLGLFGASFETKVTDTLYILSPDLVSGLTFVGLLLGVMSLLCLWDFMKNGDLPKLQKINGLLLLLMAVIPCVMTSFACDPSNLNPDLSHQMPRYLYLPAAFVAIILAQAITNKLQHPVLWLSLGIFLMIGGVFSTHNYVNTLRPYTDDLKQSIVTFIDTGRVTRMRYVGVKADAHRLDWSFNEKNIRAYLEINRKEYSIINR